MLTANLIKQKGFRVDQIYEVLHGDVAIATLNDTRSTFEIGADQYSILRKSGVFPDYVLALKGTQLASAQQAGFRNKFTVKVDNTEWLLKAEGMLALKFGLFEGETEIGTISSGGYLHRNKGIVVNVPDSFSIPVQIYLLWICMEAWTSDGS
jgi:hypothetical protein